MARWPAVVAAGKGVSCPEASATPEAWAAGIGGAPKSRIGDVSTGPLPPSTGRSMTATVRATSKLAGFSALCGRWAAVADGDDDSMGCCCSAGGSVASSSAADGMGCSCCSCCWRPCCCSCFCPAGGSVASAAAGIGCSCCCPAGGSVAAADGVGCCCSAGGTLSAATSCTAAAGLQAATEAAGSTFPLLAWAAATSTAAAAARFSCRPGMDLAAARLGWAGVAWQVSVEAAGAAGRIAMEPVGPSATRPTSGMQPSPAPASASFFLERLQLAGAAVSFLFFLPLAGSGSSCPPCCCSAPELRAAPGTTTTGFGRVGASGAADGTSSSGARWRAGRLFGFPVSWIAHKTYFQQLTSAAFTASSQCRTCNAAWAATLWVKDAIISWT